MLEIFDVEQGSQEWHELRRGLATASEFRSIMAESAERRMRASYMCRLAAERITGEVLESYSNDDMRRGKEDEPRARGSYKLDYGCDVRTVGFCRDLDKGAGASTDGLVGDDGMVEFKSLRPDLLIAKMENGGKFPGDHLWQCLGGLWITRRQWCDLVLYARGIPRLVVRRLERDPEKIARLAREVAGFNVELAAMVERVRSVQ